MNIWTNIWDFLGRIDIVFSLLATIFAGFAALKLYQQNKRIKELATTAPKLENFAEVVTYYSKPQTSNPVAFAISLLENTESIRPSVEIFLKSKDWSKNIRIEELSMNGIKKIPEDIEIFINELKKKRRQFDAERVTEVLLFIAGPVMAGTLVGAIFDNWIPVKLYHKPHHPLPSVYEYWIPLIK